MSFSSFKKALGFLVVGVLCACTPRIDHRGKLPEPDKLKQLKPGADTQEDVLRLIGSPTTVSAFDDRVWLYIHRTTETTSFFEPKTLDQKQVVITFNSQGILQSIVSQSAEKNLNPSKNITPSAGLESSWAQKIFGSYGRFAKKGRSD